MKTNNTPTSRRSSAKSTAATKLQIASAAIASSAGNSAGYQAAKVLLALGLCTKRQLKPMFSSPLYASPL